MSNSLVGNQRLVALVNPSLRLPMYLTSNDSTFTTRSA